MFKAVTNPERARLVARALVERADIEQIFTDIAYWNDNVRKPREAPIDPDPGGILRRLADGLDRMLADECSQARKAGADDARG